MSLLSQFTLEAKIVEMFPSENRHTLKNLMRILTYGALANTGNMLILPVDQGFEHGPDRSFAFNPDAYNPTYHYKLAKAAGFSALVGHIGFIEAIHGIAAQDWSPVPMVLKLNTNNLFDSANKALSPYSTQISTVEDAVRLGCIGVGFTIYPGSGLFGKMLEDLAVVIKEARKHGLVVIVWSYPRGEGLIEKEHITSSQATTAVDTLCYGAHMACLAGAHIIKVKIPSKYVYNLKELFFNGVPKKWQKTYDNEVIQAFLGERQSLVSKLSGLDEVTMQKYNELFKLMKNGSQTLSPFTSISTTDAEVVASYFYEGCYGNITTIEAIKRSCFDGKRFVIFSGGELKNSESLINEATLIASSGGNGSIIGRNAFQRKMNDAVAMVKKVAKAYLDYKS